MEKKASRLVVAENLGFYMTVCDKSRRDISNDLNISYNTITDWVNGKKMPRMDKLRLLADYFGVSVMNLLEDKTESLAESDADKPAISALLQRLSTDKKFLATVLALSALPENQHSASLLTTASAIVALPTAEQDAVAVFLNALCKQRGELAI